MKKFEYFKKQTIKYQKLFNLNNWRLCFNINESDDSNQAQVYINLSGRVATVEASRKWLNNKTCDKKEISKTAFHELVEIMLYDLSYHIPRSIDVDAITHSIIRTFENTFFEMIWKKEDK